MTQRNKQAELTAMDVAAEEAEVILRDNYTDWVSGDIAQWIRTWMPKAGYKRLCRVLLKVDTEMDSRHEESE